MNFTPGDRVRVSAAYGESWPSERKYVGEEGVFVETIRGTSWDGYLRAQLDCDESPGVFHPDELERVYEDIGDCEDCSAKAYPEGYTPCLECGAECGHAYCCCKRLSTEPCPAAGCQCQSS